MQFVAKSRFVRYSPFKLRPLVAVIRGKGVEYALGWLATYQTKRVRPIRKVLESAVANAKSLKNIKPEDLVVKEIRVDQGPIMRYYKPGAMGRATIQRKRFSHISVILEDNSLENSKEV
jgi:large subunit ribosomal protein L22